MEGAAAPTLILKYAGKRFTDRGKTSYTVGQTWAALKKTWKAYKIAKVKNEKVGMLKYAHRIRDLQRELNLPISRFPELGLN
jgi:hypothetical protein